MYGAIAINYAGATSHVVHRQDGSPFHPIQLNGKKINDVKHDLDV